MFLQLKIYKLENYYRYIIEIQYLTTCLICLQNSLSILLLYYFIYLSGAFASDEVEISQKAVLLYYSFVPMYDKSVVMGDGSVPMMDKSVAISDESVPMMDKSVAIDKESVPKNDKLVAIGNESAPKNDKSVAIDDERVPIFGCSLFLHKKLRAKICFFTR